MDVQMPELDGLDATRQICARWPAERRPRIVAMTANAMQGDREMCLAAGMDDYLTKPIRVERLVEALNGVPRARTARHERMPIDRRRDLRRAAGQPPAPTSSRSWSQTFLEEAPAMLAELRDALAAGDADTFRRAAHSLKSNSHTFGALALGALARDLELGGLDAGRAAGRARSRSTSEYARVAAGAEGAARWLTCATPRPACWWPTTTRSTACC